MKLRVLGSSSKGNCYLLSAEDGSLLIEAGLPFKEIKKGLDYNLSGIEACLVSHEHKDHSRAAENVMGAGIDVYMSKGTADALNLSGHRLNITAHKDEFRVGDFTILPFQTEHDAAEPLGFLICYKGEKVLFATDTYYLRNRFNELNYILVECNYIKETLDANIAAGYIAEGMKRRLLESHFSLDHVKEFLKANDLSLCKEIILLHLSDSNSDAARMVREIGEVTRITPKVAEPGLEVELNLLPY